MQVLVVLFRQTAMPILLHHLVPPLVGAPQSFRQLGDALDRSAPEKVPTALDERVRALVDPGGRLWGTSAMKPPSGGGNWKKSPMKITLMPPKSLSRP